MKHNKFLGYTFLELHQVSGNWQLRLHLDNLNELYLLFQPGVTAFSCDYVIYGKTNKYYLILTANNSQMYLQDKQPVNVKWTAFPFYQLTYNSALYPTHDFNIQITGKLTICKGTLLVASFMMHLGPGNVYSICSQSSFWALTM